MQNGFKVWSTDELHQRACVCMDMQTQMRQVQNANELALHWVVRLYIFEWYCK